MSSTIFVRCPQENCLLRFPGEPDVLCPLCKTPTLFAAPRVEALSPPLLADLPPLELLLDNVRSVFNVGSIFRSADGSGISALHLAGITPTPDHKAMRKTALGAEERIAWSTHRDAVQCAKELVSQGYILWALECAAGAENIFDAAPKRPQGPLVLVLGNEVAGVDSAIIPYCEKTVYIPMHGHKASLNVATAMGIAAYALHRSY